MNTFQFVVLMAYALMFFVTLGAFVFMIFFGDTEVPLLKRLPRVSLVAKVHAFCGELPRRLRPALRRSAR